MMPDPTQTITTKYLDLALQLAKDDLTQVNRIVLEEALDVLQTATLQSIEAIAAKEAIGKELDRRGYTAAPLGPAICASEKA